MAIDKITKHKIRSLEKSIEVAIENEAKVVKRSICSKDFCWKAFKTSILVLMYYMFSITLTFYNQRFIHIYKFPLSITMTHLVTKFVMSVIVRSVMECTSHKSRVTLTWSDYFKKVAPPGIASSLDIAFSNWSFEFITVSLYTMTKSTAIVFILLFSIIFKLEKPRISLVFVVLFIAGGLFMFTYESTQFNLVGFCLCLTASFLSGLRWTLAQIVLQKHEIGLSNPIDMMYHIQPWMMVALLPLSSTFEGLDVATSQVTFGFKGAIVAFGLELSEFLLVRNTSSLTLSVSGIFKELLTLLLAALINGDKLNKLNGLGLVVCLMGIILHVILKATHDSAGKNSSRRSGSVEYTKLTNSIEIISNSEEEDEVFNVRNDR